MKFKNIKNSGFTLLELLVVVAIIGILASITMIAISDSQNKSKDSRIKSQIVNLRRVTEIYYTSNNNTYGSTVSNCTSGMFADTVNEVATFTNTANYPTGTTLACFASSTAWAVSASLFGGQYWCVDSTGANRQTSTQASSTVCPAS